MTQQPRPSEFTVGDQTVSANKLAIARIQFIECFSRLEGTIAKIIVQHEPQFDLRAHFGNKLKALGQLKDPALSKKAIDRFAKLGHEVATLAKIRNDLVHGLMSVVIHENITKAALQNAADAAIDLPQFTLLSLEHLESGRKKLLQIVNELKQLANPSPPQPSPGAEGDP
jgi:hypothetical protein